MHASNPCQIQDRTWFWTTGIEEDLGFEEANWHSQGLASGAKILAFTRARLRSYSKQSDTFSFVRAINLRHSPYRTHPEKNRKCNEFTITSDHCDRKDTFLGPPQQDRTCICLHPVSYGWICYSINSHEDGWQTDGAYKDYLIVKWTLVCVTFGEGGCIFSCEEDVLSWHGYIGFEQYLMT